MNVLNIEAEVYAQKMKLRLIPIRMEYTTYHNTVCWTDILLILADITNTIMNGANVTIQPNVLTLAPPSGVMDIKVLNKASLVPNKNAVAAVMPSAANIHKKTVDTNDLVIAGVILLGL